MLRRMSAPGGNRLTKLEPAEERVNDCPTCGKAVIRKRMLGQYQVEGIYRNGTYYHYQHAPREVLPAIYPYPRKNDQIATGNLAIEEYRFWVGVKDKGLKYAMCRCCRKSTYGRDDRLAHFADPIYQINGDQCTVRLTAAYKILLEIDECVVCRKKRYKQQKWGVPLCEQKICIEKWMFGTDQFDALGVQMELQRKKAIFLAKQKQEKAELITAGFVVNGEKQTTRLWCEVCGMFIDNAAHEQTHQMMVSKEWMD